MKIIQKKTWPIMTLFERKLGNLFNIKVALEDALKSSYSGKSR